MKKIRVVTGQTATGKTSFAIQIAKKVHGEIISADSRQIYKHLDIITGKDISRGEKFYKLGNQRTEDGGNITIGYYMIDGIKVWGYDLVDPKQHFSSFDYKICIDHIISNTIDSRHIPIVVGGTYLYIKELLYGSDINIKPNWMLRNKLEVLSTEQLQKKLISLNENVFLSLNHSDRGNPRRLIRKIEIVSATRQLDKSDNQYGIPDTEYCIPHTYQAEEFVGLRFASKDKLARVIRQRVDKRLKQGAIKEVQSLLKRGYSKDDPGLQTIGYQEIIEYLEFKSPATAGRQTSDVRGLNSEFSRLNSESKDMMIKKWTTAEVQYAKRQLTFMKKDSNIAWIEM